MEEIDTLNDEEKKSFNSAEAYMLSIRDHQEFSVYVNCKKDEHIILKSEQLEYFQNLVTDFSGLKEHLRNCDQVILLRDQSTGKFTVHSASVVRTEDFPVIQRPF